MKTFKQFLIESRNGINEDYYESIDFELYNPEFGDWEDSYVMIQYDEKKKGIIWNDESNVSSKGFDDPKKALDDYKKFLSKQGFKYKGLKL